MKKIAVVALKGGVGKSSVVAGLGLALLNWGNKVGFLDIDVTGSNLFSALGLAKSPGWLLDSVNQKVVVPEVNGYWLLSIASYAGEEYAVLWERTHHQELADVRDRLKAFKENALSHGTGRADLEDLESMGRAIDDVLASSKWRFVSELLSENIVTWPEPLDYMIADLPPPTSNEMFSFFPQVKDDFFGVIIVSQPTKISATGLLRTIDLLRVQRIPIIGLVANQDGFLNKHGEIEYQFLSPRVDLQEVAKKAKIPFLASIPQSGHSQKLAPYFLELAGKVIVSKPVTLKEVTKVKKFKRELVKGVARGIAKL